MRVWLGAGGPVAPGSPVRVYAQTVADGYVVVLHRRPDGVVEVLFPGDPASDPFSSAGSLPLAKNARFAPSDDQKGKLAP